MSDVWYFAYGSNLWVDQKEFRTGTIRIGSERPQIAKLHNYRLAFNKRGSNGQVYANVVHCPNADVIGVVYRCSPTAIDTMSDFEIGYEQQTVTVTLEDSSTIDAITFVAQISHVVNEASPSEAYLKRILTGASQHCLPQDYIENVRRLAYGQENNE